MITANELLTLSRPELMNVLQTGHPIDPAQIEDQQYKGISLGLHPLVERLTWKKFGKTFYRDPRSGVLRGWNVRMMQNELEGPWQPRLRRGEPVTFGHYHVDESEPKEPYDCGLTIDYSRGGRSRGAMSRVRDPIVAVNAGSADLLLGWSYVDLCFRRVGTPSFFSLEREGPLSYTPPQA